MTGWPGPVALVAGAIVLVLTTVDFAWTTLAVSSGGGPMSRTVSLRLWEFGVGRLRRRPAFLAPAGLVAAMMPFVVWITLLWLGWWLVFLGSPGAVLSSVDSTIAGIWERAYFAGYSIFTLGNGDFRPIGAGWQIGTVLAALHGLSFVTFGITYLLSVLSAAVERRELAVSIRGLGESATHVVIAGWSEDERSFDVLVGDLTALAPRVIQLAERHYAYPVLHLFHSTERSASAPAMLAMLADAVALLDLGVAPSVRPARSLQSVRWALDRFASVVGPGHVESPPVPAAPDLATLSQSGVPVVTEEEYRRAMDGIAPSRRTWAGIVCAAGWSVPADGFTP